MPSIEELKALIREFREQGVSDEEIRTTLKEMDVDSSLIDNLLSGQEESGKEKATPAPTDTETTPEEPSIEDVPPPTLPQEPPEETPDEEITTLPVVETAEQVKELHQRVSDLHEKVATVDDMVEIKERLAAIESDIRDINAQLKALRKILQDVLNTNRSILVDLYERSKECK